MKTKLKNVIFAEGIMDHMKILAQFDLPIRESVKAIKLIKELTNHFQIFDEARIKLLNKYGTINKKEKKYAFETDDKQLQFNNEFGELQGIEFELDHEIINLPEDAKIKPAFLINCDKFVNINGSKEN